MNSIFVRIYGGILVALLIIGALTYAGVELVNDYRSQLYRERMARGTFYLMAEGYRERASDEERQAWSRSLSRMFGAPVSLRDAGLGEIVVGDGFTEIGAMATHAGVAGSGVLADRCPAICDLAGQIGDPAVRHRGTIGGSIANNDPAARPTRASPARGGAS